MSDPVQIVDNLALVPLTASEVANLNLQSMGVVTIVSPNAPGAMLTSQFATINPGAGFVDKAITAQNVAYTGLTGLPGSTTLFLRADGTFATPPGQTYSVVTTAGPGLAPTLPSSSGFSYFLRGDGAWQLISSLSIGYGQLTGVPLTFTPSIHAVQHITGGNDVIPSATTAKSGLVPVLPSSFQTLNFLRGDSTWAQVPLATTGAAGLIPAITGSTIQFFRADGNYAQPVYAQLASIPSSFNPSPHAAQHVTGGNDVIANFLIGGAISGLVPGSPGGTTAFLRADGTWAAPQGPGNLANSGGAGLLQQLQPTNQTLYYLRGDNTWVLISSLSIAYSQITGVPVFAGGSAGLVPNSVGGVTTFLRADGTFAAPSGSSLASSSGAGLIAQLPASAQTTYYARGDNSWQLVATLTFDWSQITTGVPTSFAPSAHAQTHFTGGSDPIPAPTTAKSGLVPPLPTINSITSFLRGDGTFATIPLAVPGTPGLVPSPTNLQQQFLRGDATFAAIPTVTSSVAGLAPAFPGNPVTFFRGDGTYNSVTYASLTGVPSTFAPSAHATQHITLGNDIIPSFTATASGLVPLSGGGTSNFLRADGTWQTPSGAGDVFHTLTITGINSIQGGGDLSTNRTLQLTNDAATPGNWQIYSTDGGGLRGWHASTTFPQATSTTAGLVPTPTGQATQFLSGTAVFSVPPNFSTSTAGYAPASGGGTANFLRADGQWTAPPTASLASTSAAGIVPQLPATLGSTYFLRGDNSWQLISGLSIAFTQITGVPTFAGGNPGLVPNSTGNASQFLRGDGQFAQPALAASGAPGYISALPAPNATAFWARGDNSWQVLPDSALVLSPWIMPAVGASLTSPGVLLTSSSIFVAGMTILTGSPSCFMEVTFVSDATHVILTNRGYANNPTAGTTISGGLMFITSPGIMTGATVGLVPLPPSDATKFLSGAGTWLVPAASSGTVFTQFSVGGNGSSGSPIQFVNDVNAPGSFMFYSTDANGIRGWFPLVYSWETNAIFVLPGVGGTQTVTFTNTVGMTAGTTLVFEDNNVPANQAFLEVVSVNIDGIHAVIKNQGYALNSSPGVTFNTSASVTLAGPGVASGGVPGFVPQTTSNTVSFLRADGQFATPANFTTSTSGYAPASPGGNTQFLRADGTWQVPSVGSLASTGQAGAVVGLPASNQTVSFLRGDNSWQLISSMAIGYGQLTGVPSTFAPSAHASSHISTGADAISLFSTTTTVSGLVPGSNNVGTTFFLRADGTWQTPPTGPGLATTGSAGLVAGLPASNQTTSFLRGDNSWQLISSMSIGYSQLTGVPSTFAPSAHAASHLDNGTDPIAVVAGLRTGLVPVLPAAAPTTKFLRGDATWTVIPGVTGGAAGLVPAFPSNNTTYFRGDGTYAAVPTATSTTGGLVPTPPNLTTQWFRGDATFATLPFSWNITTSFTQPNIGSPITVNFTATAGLVTGMAIATVDSGNQTNYYTVSSVTNTTQAVLINTGASGNTAATSTVNPGTVLLSGLPIMSATGTGIVPIPPNDSTKFLNGAGAWAVPSPTGVVPTSRQILTPNSVKGGGDLTADRTLQLDGDTGTPADWAVYSVNGSTHARGWNASTVFPVATTGAAGLLPQLDGNTSHFLNGNGAFAAPSSLPPASTGVAGTVNGLPASNQTTQWLRADNSWQFLPNTNATTASWVMPAVAATVTAVTFQSTAAFAAGMTLFFSTGSSTTNCFMEVVSVDSGTTLTLRNRGYSINPVSTTTIPACQVTVATPGIATTSNTGLVPLPPNNTNTFLRGDATFSQVDYSNLTNPPTIVFGTTTTASFTQPNIGLTVNIAVVTSSGLVTNRGLLIIGGGYYTITAVPDGTHITIRNDGFAYNASGGATVGATATAVMGSGFANLFSSTAAGAVPLSGGGTTNFLRADGTWAAIPVATATTSGLVPTPPNNTTTFLRGDATFATPPSATATVAGYVPTPPNNTTTFLRGDATFAAIPAATATVAGLVPTPPNDTSKWLRGDATWQSSPPLTLTATATFTWPAAAGTVAIQVVSSALMMVGTGLYFPAFGLAEVTVVTDTTHITIRNNGNSGNAGSGTVAVGTAIYSSGAGSLATSTTSGMIPTPPNNQTAFLRGDASFATPPSATATVAGYVPTPPNDITKFLRGDATWVTPFNAGQATVNFGSTDSGDDAVASTTVTATWVNGTTSFIQVSVVPGSDHADEDPWVEDIEAYTQNIVNGASFDIVLHAPTGAVGNYLVNYLSN